MDKPWAGRLTKRGMSWGRGLPGFVRLLNLHLNGTLQTWLEHSSDWRPIQPVLHDAVRAMQRGVPEEEGTWLQARMPALMGPKHPLHRTLRDLGHVRSMV